MRPRSNRGEEVVFAAKDSSVPREREEEDEREEEFEVRAAEKPVKEVRVVAHSSFRISVYYTPAGKKGEANDGRLRHDDFYLLFELRSPREYGEISLFCHVCTCACIVHADSKITFDSCVTDACYTKNWSIQNKVPFSLFFSPVLAAGAPGVGLWGLFAHIPLRSPLRTALAGTHRLAASSSQTNPRNRLRAPNPAKLRRLHPRRVPRQNPPAALRQLHRPHRPRRKPRRRASLRRIFAVSLPRRSKPTSSSPRTRSPTRSA